VKLPTDLYRMPRLKREAITPFCHTSTIHCVQKQLMPLMQRVLQDVMPPRNALSEHACAT
jgi:hypothetical protein